MLRAGRLHEAERLAQQAIHLGDVEDSPGELAHLVKQKSCASGTSWIRLFLWQKRPFHFANRLNQSHRLLFALWV